MNCRALGMMTVAATIVAGCGGHDELFGEPAAHIGSIDGGSAIVAGDEPKAVVDGADWPSCAQAPLQAVPASIHEVWQQDVAAASAVWLEGVYVTAVSGGRCQLNVPCQLVVQQHERYGSADEAARNAISVRVSDSVAHYFDSVSVGDQIDLSAQVWRQSDEVGLEISSLHPGCARVVGDGDPVPVPMDLDALNVGSYHATYGPILVRIDTLLGIPGAPDETFALWTPGGPANEAHERSRVSPHYLPAYEFVGLEDGVLHDFASISGVFGVLLDDSDGAYKTVFVRWMSDIALGPQQL